MLNLRKSKQIFTKLEKQKDSGKNVFYKSISLESKIWIFELVIIFVDPATPLPFDTASNKNLQNFSGQLGPSVARSDTFWNATIIVNGSIIAQFNPF